MTVPRSTINYPPSIHYSNRTSNESISLFQDGTEPDLRFEATELRSTSCEESQLRQRRLSDLTTLPDDIETEETIRRCQLRRQELHWYDGINKFWKRQVAVAVPANAQRDHLALERTFLGYLRTSVMLSMTGVIIAQLFRLQHSVKPDNELGYFVLGTPLAAAFISAAMLVTALGAFRFWRQQNAMVRGKIYAGGWEITVIMVASILLCTATFALALGAGIRRDT